MTALATTAIRHESSSVERGVFGHLPDGRAVAMVSLRGDDGFEARIIAYGEALQALMVPDADGAVADVVLGHDDLQSYVEERNFFGATIGRFANRIADGRFVLDGAVHRLPANDGGNTLHGGDAGFDRQLWQVEEAGAQPQPSVTLTRTSHHDEEGYPGTLTVRVCYRLTAPGELTIDYAATTDRPTIVNLTNHSFFNLAGGGDILGHRLLIPADRYLPTDAALIPRGAPEPVAGTPFDFREPRTIGSRIREDHEQIRLAQGYDHCFCLQPGDGPLHLAARLEAPGAGRVLEILTDQPGLQFYSGNFLDGGGRGKAGLHRQSDGLCLEPQRFPDAPNQPGFPSARLDPGTTYRHRSVYRFSAGPARECERKTP